MSDGPEFAATVEQLSNIERKLDVEIPWEQVKGRLDEAYKELGGGITVFIKEDHSAPSIDLSFRWLGGSNSTPVEDLAPFRLAGDLLDEGGTEELDPIALQERKEAWADAYHHTPHGQPVELRPRSK